MRVLQNTDPIDGIRDLGDLPCLFEKSEGAALAIPSRVTDLGAAPPRVYGWTKSESARCRVQGISGLELWLDDQIGNAHL